MKYAISACLMGKNCKYSGGNNAQQEIIDFMKDKSYILVCPEVRGGLPTPRTSCEIVDGRILNSDGEDKSEEFLKGAREELKKLFENNVDLVILQPRSPSCGVGQIYDGSFQGRLMKGNGVFAQMCIDNGLTVVNSNEFLEINLNKEV